MDRTRRSPPSVQPLAGADSGKAVGDHWRRAVYAASAAVAWAGLLLSGSVAVGDSGAHPDLLPRLLYWISYFTIISNIVAAVIATRLALRPRHRGAWFDALRMDAVLMISVTGIIYNVMLAPHNAANGTIPTGLAAAANNLTHVVTPLVTVIVFLFVDYRGRMDALTVRRSMALPIGWLLYALTMGAAVSWYPYGFLSTPEHGYLVVLANCLAVLVFCALLGALFKIYDQKAPIGR